MSAQCVLQLSTLAVYSKLHVEVLGLCEKDQAYSKEHILVLCFYKLQLVGGTSFALL